MSKEIHNPERKGLRIVLSSSAKRASGGFSLVELLLTLVLILCLAAASVFSYTAMHRSANLDEGVSRLESLIRFAQAEAATTGRKVQLQFPAARPADQASSATAPLREINVMWEPDFLTAPGVFQQYTNKSWSEQMVNELVGVTQVRSIQPDRPTPMVPDNVLADAAQDLPGEGEESASVETDEFPTITFYPDGSCDSAAIVLASRNEEDSRLLEVRLSGILGSVSSRLIAKASDNGDVLDMEGNGTLTQGDMVSSTQDPADEFDF